MKEENKLNTMELLEATESASTEVVETVKSEDEIRKLKKMQLIKIGVMLLLAALIMIFMTIAWFTMSREVEGTGTQMTATSMPFSFEFPGTDEGKWIAKYRTLSDQAGIWLVDTDNNLDNGTTTAEEELGLEPGDSGVLEFRIRPEENNSITVDLCFTLRAFEKTNNNAADLPLVEITDTAPALMKFINAHIMLFEDIDENGKYTGLIKSNAQLERFIRNKSYSKNSAGYTKLYWVWPMHLSNLISAQQSELVYNLNEREDVIEYIADNKEGFFKDIDPTITKTALSADLDSMTHYGGYSIMFDKADLEIGKNIRYVILGLSASTVG
ncbi:hypothetical protein SAMN02910317_01999 [Ruminococcaceae bacterium FB2012]|nr:hypothetical protein SAMN02910317_01999 [Ruminococcaceae bacterium FB2012]